MLTVAWDKWKGMIDELCLTNYLSICSIPLSWLPCITQTLTHFFLVPVIGCTPMCRSMFVDVWASKAADTTRELEISLSKSRILTNKAWEMVAYWLRTFLWHLVYCSFHPPLWSFKLCLSSWAWTVDQEQGWRCKAKCPVLHLLWPGVLFCPMCWDWRGFFSPWTWNGSHLASRDGSLLCSWLAVIKGN